MSILHPWALFAAGGFLFVGVACGLVLSRNFQRRLLRLGGAGSRHVDAESATMRPKLLSIGLQTLAWIMIAIAVARPQGPSQEGEGINRGVNLAVLIDASRSMLAEDVLPSRLAIARACVDRVGEGAVGSRFSLFMFSGTTTMIMPATFDASALSLAANSVDPELAGRGGSVLGDAIDRAARYLHQSEAKGPRVMLLLSDGEETEGDPLLAALRANAEHGIRIVTVCVGTTDGGTIPHYVVNQRGVRERSGEVMDRGQRPVITRADSGRLAAIASATGGNAFVIDAAGNVDGTMSPLINSLLDDAVVLEDGISRAKAEYWPWFIALGLAILVAEQLVRNWLARRRVVELPRRRLPILEPAPLNAIQEVRK